MSHMLWGFVSGHAGSLLKSCLNEPNGSSPRAFALHFTSRTYYCKSRTVRNLIATDREIVIGEP